MCYTLHILRSCTMSLRFLIKGERSIIARLPENFCSITSVCQMLINIKRQSTRWKGRSSHLYTVSLFLTGCSVTNMMSYFDYWIRISLSNASLFDFIYVVDANTEHTIISCERYANTWLIFHTGTKQTTI